MRTESNTLDMNGGVFTQFALDKAKEILAREHHVCIVGLPRGEDCKRRGSLGCEYHFLSEHILQSWADGYFAALNN